MFRTHSTVDPSQARLELFGFSRNDATELCGAGTPIDLTAGTELCVTGATGREAFILLTGSAVVVTEDNMTVFVSAGAVIGERAALDISRPRNATVTLLEDSVVLVFDSRTFRYLAARPFGPQLQPARH